MYNAVAEIVMIASSLTPGRRVRQHAPAAFCPIHSTRLIRTTWVLEASPHDQGGQPTIKYVYDLLALTS